MKKKNNVSFGNSRLSPYLCTQFETSRNVKRTFFLIILYAGLAVVASCTHRSGTTGNEKTETAWQQYDKAKKAQDLERTVAAIDNLEQADIINEARADYLRGLAYDQGWQMRIAEIFYKKAFESVESTDSPNYTNQEWQCYTDAGYRWACLRFARGDTEGALSIVSELLTQAEENEAFPKKTKLSLQMLMADSQMQLHQYDNVRSNWEKAYETYQQLNNEGAQLPWVSLSISSGLFKMGDVAGAQEWLDRGEQEFARYEEQGDPVLIEEWKGHIALMRARNLQATGRTAEAAATFAAIPRSRISEPRAYTEAADYLMAAKRYDEAAYWYEQLDSSYMATDGAQMTFDNIAVRLSPRYTALRKAGRNGDAMVIADSICVAIDSALVWQKKNDAAELAIIYQTNEKELQLSAFNYKLKLHRFIFVALVVILLLIAYLLWRTRIYNKVLATKNRGLYEQIRQLEQAEAVQREQMQAQPVESLSQNGLLYRRLCELMEDPGIYTHAETNQETLARLLNTNRTYINSALHECADMTPADFINQYRIRHAARLLASTDDPIGIIIEQSGITNRATFSRLFREHYSMTPSEFRHAAGGKSY